MILEAIDTDIYENDELKHWGIIGMKWGIRRYQNPDGSLTPEGRERYGVGTAAETKKLSYSQKYETLKNKKNRTEKEEETFKRLKEGKKYFEASAKDPDYWNKFKNEHNYVQNELALDKYREYLASTNYGKGMISAGAMMSIPTTALGAAVDVGALFIEDRMGLPFYITGLGISTMLPVGMGLGGQLYEDKNLSKLQEELSDGTNKTKESPTNNQKTNDMIKKLAVGDYDVNKSFGEDTAAVGVGSPWDFVKNNFTKSVNDTDIKSNEKIDYKTTKNLLSKFDLNTKDLAKNDNGTIVRKDGKDFEFNYYGKNQHIRTLEGAYKTLMAGGEPIATAKLFELNSSREAPSSGKSKSEQRDEYFSKNYNKLFTEIVNNLEKQGYDIFVDGVDGYAWRTDGGDFTYKGHRANEVDSLVIDILDDEFNKKYL